MMFLAHFSKTALEIILEWPCSTIIFWYNEAIALYKKINSEISVQD